MAALVKVQGTGNNLDGEWLDKHGTLQAVECHAAVKRRRVPGLQ